MAKYGHLLRSVDEETGELIAETPGFMVYDTYEEAEKVRRQTDEEYEREFGPMSADGEIFTSHTVLWKDDGTYEEVTEEVAA